MCIKNLCYSNETYLLYNLQREKQVEIYMWALHHELVLFQKSRNCFRYVPENEIEGYILVWTMSRVRYDYIEVLIQCVTPKMQHMYHNFSRCGVRKYHKRRKMVFIGGIPVVTTIFIMVRGRLWWWCVTRVDFLVGIDYCIQILTIVCIIANKIIIIIKFWSLVMLSVCWGFLSILIW